MSEYLLKRAKRAKTRLNCGWYYAFEIARAYANYLNWIEIDGECIWFDEFMDQYEN